MKTNEDYLSDERTNLNIQLSQPIIIIGDIGRWNGRVMGYKTIDSGNIKDCLYSDTDYTEWYVDKYGDLRADAAHHDGTNHYLYRVFKDTATESQVENLKYKLYKGKATRADITRITRRLGDEIAAVYGFHIPKQRTSQLKGQSGSIGHLRGNFGSGEQFYTTWDEHNGRLKTPEFSSELDDVINKLRSNAHGLLKSRRSMADFARKIPESSLKGAYTTEYGFRVDTEKFSYLLRCNPTQEDYNFYCFCYQREWLNDHLDRAKQDIRFIDSGYKELFRLPDGEQITIISVNGQKRDFTCRYIDEAHLEVGNSLYHICEFAERMERSGSTYQPKEIPLPRECLSTLPSSGEMIMITRYQKGYTPRSIQKSPEENRVLVDRYNKNNGISKAQEVAMVAGSLFGWDTPAAKPKNYDENGKAIKPKEKER